MILAKRIGLQRATVGGVGDDADIGHPVHHGLHHLAAYNAAKHAVVGLVKGLAADLVGTGVTACAVSPGSTRTPMLQATAALYGLDDVDAFAANQLLRRILEPEEVAATIAFCCSREAVALNGSVVQADGGFAP